MPPSRIALRDDYDAVRLRRLARASRDSRQTRRLLALAAVYDGMSREAAAAVGGMDRQTLRDWVHRFNAEGPDGLTDRPRSGMPRRLVFTDDDRIERIFDALHRQAGELQILVFSCRQRAFRDLGGHSLRLDKLNTVETA